MADYTIQGTKPGSLANHMIDTTYTIAGITPEDFIKTHGGLALDYNELKNKFKKHCYDYMEELRENTKSYALEFCSKVIYEVGPQSRKVRKNTGDKIWKFIIPTRDGNDKHTVFIATFKQEGAIFSEDEGAKHIVLSLKQAALIAHETFHRAAMFAYGKDSKQLLLTPLAGACFCRDDIPALATLIGKTVVSTLDRINQGTQSGGQVLPKSDVNFAVCAAISATKGLKDENMKKGIVIKTLKQYIAAGHIPRMDIIQKVAGYATGGVPQEFNYDELIKQYDIAQRNISAMKIRQAQEESIMQSTVQAPQGIMTGETSGQASGVTRGALPKAPKQ